VSRWSPLPSLQAEIIGLKRPLQWLNGIAVKRTEGAGQPSAMGSYFSPSHCRMDAKNLHRACRYGHKSVCLPVCVIACPPLTANIRQTLRSAQVSGTVSSLPTGGNNLLSKRQEVKGVMLKAGEPLQERSSVHASALGNLSLELSQG